MPTPRLPIPNSDDGIWGDILNNYLDQSLNADGTLRMSAVGLAGGELSSNKGQAFGYAALDGSAKLLPANLPTIAVSGTAGGDLTGNYPNPTLTNTANVNSIISSNSTVAGALQKVNNLSDIANFGASRANIQVAALTPATVVSVSNISALSGLQTIDGNVLASGDLILLTGQTNAIQNGLWLPALGAWTRPTEFASGLLVKGRTCRVLKGTAFAGTDWTLVVPTAGITVDSNPQTWNQFMGAAGVPGATGPVGLVWLGAYSNTTTYATNDAVQFNGSAYITTAGTTGVNPGIPANPTSPWQLLVQIGAPGPSGSGGAGIVSPANQGLLAWSFDPIFANATAAVFTGQIYGTKVVTNAATITGVAFYISVLGATLTANQNFIGLYDSSGNLQASTVDLTASWSTGTGTTGVKYSDFSAPFSSPGGTYYIGFLSNGTTVPKFQTSTSGLNSSLINVMHGIGTFRSGQLGGVGSQTSLPATLILANTSLLNITPWAGLY